MPDTNDREVNKDVEVINLSDDAAEETQDDGDDTVIEAVEDPKTRKVVADEPDDASESSPDVESDGDDAVTEEISDPSKTKTPAPVTGETPREKALRLEVQRLKKEKREQGIQKMVGNDAPANSSTDDEAIKELKQLGYSDEEITNMEKAVDVLARKKGYIKADQAYHTTVNTVLAEFINQNTEFKPENDPEDVRWNTFDRILKEGTYNIQNKTPEQLTKIFKRIKSDVDEELGEPEATVEVKRDAAQRQKIKSVSHSGGTKPVVEKKKSSIAPEVRSMFKGFEDDDLE